MTAQRRGSLAVSYPDALEILVIREFEAPCQLVFDALTQPEHVIKTIAPRGEEVRRCSIDLRVGGSYHYVFIADDGTEMSFRGTFVEIDPPCRAVQTWFYDGWPSVKAVESVELADGDGFTTMSYRLRFADLQARSHMTGTDGIEANFDNVEDLLMALLEAG